MTELHERLLAACRDAVQCQNACNLSGVLFSFARHMQTLCDLDLGTAQRASHPVTVLFLDKLAQLAGGLVQWPDDAYGRALRDAEDLLDAAQRRP